MGVSASVLPEDAVAGAESAIRPAGDEHDGPPNPPRGRVLDFRVLVIEQSYEWRRTGNVNQRKRTGDTPSSIRRPMVQQLDDSLRSDSFQ